MSDCACSSACRRVAATGDDGDVLSVNVNVSVSVLLHLLCYCMSHVNMQ